MTTARRSALLWQAVENHLGSRDVARVVYGSILGLALVVALEQHPPTTAQTIAAVVATALAIGLAETYSEFVGAEARERRHLSRAEVRVLAEDAAAVTFGAGFPAVFFILAAAGVMELATAFTLAKWTGLALICAYGYVAARLAGSGTGASLLHASALGMIGVALITVKALLH